MAGIKSTIAFLGINGLVGYADPSALPVSLGLTIVPYLIYICWIMIATMIAMMFGNGDEEERGTMVQKMMDQVSVNERRRRQQQQPQDD